MERNESTIGVGILGAGQPNIATSCQIPACQASKQVRLVSLCDRLESVREVARDCGARATTDYAEMLADPEVEMVQVATPDWCHVDHARQALEAGKHVLLQKPICTHLDDLHDLEDVAAQSAGKLKILLNNRHTVLTRTLRAAVEAGLIGELRHVNIQYRGHRYPIDNPDSPYLKAEHGGVWVHNGLHWLDEACAYAEMPPSSVHAVATRNDNGPQNLLGEGPNYWCGLFRLGPNATFRFEYNTMLLADGLPGGMQRTLIGTEGELRVDYGADRARLFPTAPVESPLLEAADEPSDLPVYWLNPIETFATPNDATIDSFRRAIDDFAAEIRDGVGRPPVLADSCRCMETLLLSTGGTPNECPEPGMYL
jgi:predicted dehydrogenase